MRTGNTGTIPCGVTYEPVFPGLITSLNGRGYKPREVGKKVPEKFQLPVSQAGSSGKGISTCSHDQLDMH